MVLFDNLAEASTLTDVPVPVASYRWEAIAFSTQGEALTLSTVTLFIDHAGFETSPFNLALYADAPGPFPDYNSPGTRLAELYSGDAASAGIPEWPTPGAGHPNVVFGNLNQPLAANTTYWLVAESLGNAFGWYYPTSPSPNEGTGLSIGEASSSDLGANWSAGPGTQRAKIEAVVPEPASAGLLLGTGALLALRRRR